MSPYLIKVRKRDDFAFIIVFLMVNNFVCNPLSFFFFSMNRIGYCVVTYNREQQIYKIYVILSIHILYIHARMRACANEFYIDNLICNWNKLGKLKFNDFRCFSWHTLGTVLLLKTQDID